MGCLPRKIAVIAFACGAMQAADVPTCEKTVAPMLTRTCAPCHNENVSSGGVDIAGFTQAASLTKSREGWDIILRKIRAGEMPPKGVPRPAEMDAAVQFLAGEFEKADRSVKPHPRR